MTTIRSNKSSTFLYIRAIELSDFIKFSSTHLSSTASSLFSLSALANTFSPYLRHSQSPRQQTHQDHLLYLRVSFFLNRFHLKLQQVLYFQTPDLCHLIHEVHYFSLIKIFFTLRNTKKLCKNTLFCIAPCRT